MVLSSSSTHAGQAARAVATAVALAAVVAVAARLAWLGDDAYITLRSVENWASGNGLRWNPTDRVQTYTHPLWMAVLTLGRWGTGEVYFTTLSISLCLSLGAAAWLLLRARSAATVALTALVLLGSRAFCDYTTSGLETPLTFALLAAFVANALGDRPPLQRYTVAVLLANLLTLNRMDLALVCLPAVLAAMRGVPLRAVVVRGALMSTPFLGWLAFAGLYYGSPFPVTAHAKAFGVGIPSAELFEQGVRYVLHTLGSDPVTFSVAIAGSVALLISRRTRWLALGGLLYVAYFVKVGGGFMQGRFFLPPFFVALAGAAPWLARMSSRASITASLAVLGVTFAAGPPSWAGAPSGDTPLDEATIEAQHGIVDERRMYYRELGLLSATRRAPAFGQLEHYAFPEGREELWWLLNGAVGVSGYQAGADGHIVDPLLCDPLIARLPARDPARWRIGHVLRRIPEGYWESLRDDDNRIHHPGLRRYYEALRSLTRDPVFDGGRLAALWDMARGVYDDDFRAFVAEDYYEPPRVEVDVAALAHELPAGAFWFDEPAVKVVYGGGLEVRLPSPRAAARLDVQVLGICQFRFRFVRDGQVVGDAMGVPQPQPPVSDLRRIAGLRSEVVTVPDGTGPFDAVWVDYVEVPLSSNAVGPPGIGRLVLSGE